MSSRSFPPAHLSIVALVLMTFVAVGCGNKDKSEPTGGQASTDSAKAKAGSKDKASTGSDSKGSVQSSKALAKATKDTINITIAGDPETLDPAKMTGAPEGRVAFNAFEGLFMPAQTTGKPVYGVAKSHTVSDDGKTWTITLRDDAKWSNGDPVTSEDFVYAWKRVLTPGFDAEYAEFLDKIKGAAEYRSKKTEDWATVGLKTPDPKTLVIELNNPTPYFDEMLAFYTFFPVHKKSVEAHGDKWTDPANYVTNGPYKMGKYARQQFIVLEKNENYWDKANVKIPNIKIHLIKDNTAALNAFKEGKIDIVANIPIGQIPALKGKPEFRIDPMLGTYYYRVNVKANDVLAKPEVRKALSMSVDRKALTQRTLKGLHKASNGFVPKMPSYTQKTTLEFDPDKARDLLKAAGYPDGKGFPATTLLFNTDKNHKLVAELIQNMWKRELGIDIKLENQEWKTYLASVSKGNYEIARAGWIGDYSDPETFLKILMGSNGNNNTGWVNERYDALLEASNSETDPKKRLEMLAQAEEILISELPIIPIYHYRNALLVSKRIDGFKTHNRDVHLVKYMTLK